MDHLNEEQRRVRDRDDLSKRLYYHRFEVQDNVYIWGCAIGAIATDVTLAHVIRVSREYISPGYEMMVAAAGGLVGGVFGVALVYATVAMYNRLTNQLALDSPRQ